MFFDKVQVFVGVAMDDSFLGGKYLKNFIDSFHNFIHICLIILDEPVVFIAQVADLKVVQFVCFFRENGRNFYGCVLSFWNSQVLCHIIEIEDGSRHHYVDFPEFEIRLLSELVDPDGFELPFYNLVFFLLHLDNPIFRVFGVIA